jgi:hypothetical protein
MLFRASIITEGKTSNYDDPFSTCRRPGASKACDAKLCPAHPQGSRQAAQSQPLVAGQGAHARRWPPVHPGRSFHSLQRSSAAAVDEVPAAPINQRAVIITALVARIDMAVKKIGHEQVLAP